MSLAPGARLGAYEIIGLLGAGGMGEVYRARDPKLQREVAIKILPEAFAADPERLARFQREAHVLASLNHPNIAAIYGMEDGPPEGGPHTRHGGPHMRALVLELVEGPTLADRVAQGPIPVDDALSIARQIAEALETAHEHGVIHRDLKPANIKLRPDGAVKVLDFGLAKALEHDRAAASASLSLSPTITRPVGTVVGVILGTAAYMSPEQARGKAVDKRSDIWAFGCVLYEMLAGQPAFAGEDVSLIISKILQRDVDWSAVRSAPPPVQVLLHRCLEKDPKKRLRDIGEARLLLDGASHDRLIVHDVPALFARRIPLMLAVPVLVAAILLTAVGTWWARPAETVVPAPVVRLAVALRSGEQVGDGSVGAILWPPLALAPSGKHLAYVSAGRLHLRALDSLGAQPATGSEGAWGPFFSPDGQQVGFFAQGGLRRISVGGGAAERLIDAPVGAGGDWGADDTIYFVPLNFSPIWKMPARGGMREPVTTLQPGEVSHRWPQVLPGGAAILFTVWRGPGWDEMDVQLQVLATGERRVIAQGASTGRYVPTGHVVYSRAGELMAAPFDLANLRVSGQPVPLNVQVREGEGGHFALSDSGLLAYSPGQGQYERRLVIVNGSGAVERLPAPVQTYEDAVFSPDGTRVAVTVSGATWRVWIHDLDRNTQTPITSGASSQWPVWTPDGTRIIYRGTRSGSRNLYWKAADGSGDEERLTTGSNLQTARSVTPDGTLAFTEASADTGSDIWVMSVTGDRQPRRFIGTTANEEVPAFSPDGRWMAYSSNSSGRQEIYVVPFPGPGGSIPVSSSGGDTPVWSRDGRQLFFVNGTTMMAADILPGNTFRVGAVRAVFRNDDQLEEFDVDARGRFLRIHGGASQDAGTQIHVVVNWFEELKRLVPAR